MAGIRKRQIKDLSGSVREGLQMMNRNAARQRSDAAPPRIFRGQRGAPFLAPADYSSVKA